MFRFAMVLTLCLAPFVVAEAQDRAAPSLDLTGVAGVAGFGPNAPVEDARLTDGFEISGGGAVGGAAPARNPAGAEGAGVGFRLDWPLASDAFGHPTWRIDGAEGDSLGGADMLPWRELDRADGLRPGAFATLLSARTTLRFDDRFDFAIRVVPRVGGRLAAGVSARYRF